MLRERIGASPDRIVLPGSDGHSKTTNFARCFDPPQLRPAWG
jgi:hypothetical protein